MFRSAGFLLLLAVSGLGADPPSTESEKALVAEVKQLQADVAKAYGEGRLTDVAALMEKQVATLRKLHPKGADPVIAGTLRNLGVIKANIGQPGQGLEILNQSLVEYEGAYPAGHHDTASLLVQVAQINELMGNRPKTKAALDRALVILDGLFPVKTHPDGHPTLIHVLYRLGQFHMESQEYELARPHVDRAVVLGRKLYAPGGVPNGNADLVQVLAQQGRFRHIEGKFPEAIRLLEEALAAAQVAFPPARYPTGHMEIANILTRLGAVYDSQEAADKAVKFHEESLAMRRRLFPNGSAELAAGLSDAGYAQSRVGAYDKADAYQREAVSVCEKLFPPARFPAGTPIYRTCLNNHASILSHFGKTAEAAAIYEKLVDWERKALPGRSKELGLYDLARALNNFGSTCLELPDYARGRAALEESLKLYQERFPKEHYKLGHPQITLALYNLGAADFQAGDDARAADYLCRSLSMGRGFLTERFGFGSEAEALDRARNMPPARNTLLSATRTLPDGPSMAYEQVWGDKALVARALERRHIAARLAVADPAIAPAVKTNWERLVEVRRQIHEATLNPGSDPAAARTRLSGLTDQKEQLERALGAVLPDLARQPDPATHTPVELSRRLPPRTVVVDFLRYTAIDRDPATPGPKGLKPSAVYTAFVLTSGGPVRRVEMGPCTPIDAAVASWRKAILTGETGQAATAVRKLVWDPVAALVPADTETVFIAPDGALTRIPWVALPGRKADTVLLEDHAVAVVPHAPYLLDRLMKARPRTGTERVLALGEVRYGSADKPYPALPATAAELAGMTAAAGTRELHVLRGSDADVAHLRVELPKARYAHLATHAFFAEAAFAAEPTAKDAPGLKAKPSGSGARNPLAYTGLVLAGANQPDTAPERGIASGETIVDLSLDNLRLAVLSACETGLGAIDNGEGVQGLTRAFHLAGCPNVVASLWQVNDAATAALMTQFYHELWVNEKSPLQALRAAQLTIYRHPERIAALAGNRGRPALAEAVRIGPAAATTTEKTTPTRLWAAFVLSGLGQ
jgi:CHAT domain-containing protein/tetratricopeptide (TPR) repeat protein